MIHIKKTIFIFVISLLFLSKANAVIKDALFATVGNKAITQSDIVNEVKTILILNGQAFSESQRTQIESAAIKSIIKRTVKQIEISKYKTLQYNMADLNKELKNMASNLNVSLETLKKVFSRNEIDFSNVIDRVKTDLLWNSLIFEIYKNRLSINIDEIDEQLKFIQKKKEIEEYLISEIIVRNVQK